MVISINGLYKRMCKLLATITVLLCHWQIANGSEMVSKEAAIAEFKLRHGDRKLSEIQVTNGADAMVILKNRYGVDLFDSQCRSFKESGAKPCSTGLGKVESSSVPMPSGAIL